MNKYKLLMAMLIFAPCSTYASQDASNNIQKVIGNSLSPIELSNRSVNDVLCENGTAIDYFVSESVPIIITKIPDGSGWIVTYEYLQNKNNPIEIRYFSEEQEVYFICSTGTFKTSIKPVHEKSKTVILSDGGGNKIHTNLEFVRGRDIEEVAVEFALKVINDNGSGIGIPDSYTIKPAPSSIRKWHQGIVGGVTLRPERSIKIDGVGLRADEFTIKAERDIELRHVNFLKTPLGGNIFTVTIEDTRLIKGEKTTVVITHLERGI
ncbi:TraK domain-containing protein [Vibrio crassostreae]|uniref:TraK domain-containing protein n=1 Tax=Vibrio crassostreae TaxID=246167 RepID=UPI000632B259|nr:type-F conjugative transfer system secretin TraK [Vibrio crassostreae]CDT76412.1 conserved exported hypothetical protein [Vibrio crassostreae]